MSGCAPAGVERVFGYPGDGINGSVAAFEHGGDGLYDAAMDHR